MTLLDLLRGTASRHSVDHTLGIGDRRYTFADLEGGSNAAARVLRSHGVARGDRVCLFGGTSIDYLLACLGTQKLAAVPVPVNPAYQAEELGHIVSDCEPLALVADAARLPVAKAAIAGRAVTLLSVEREHTAADSASGEDDLGVLPFYQALQKASVHPVDEIVGDDDLGLILYTSGTTGRPRGAMLLHVNLEANARALVRAFRWTTHDLLVHALPLFHVHGLCVAFHGTLIAGCEAHFLPHFDAGEVLATLRARRATIFMGVPTMYHRLLSAQRERPVELPSMRLFVSGSAPLPAALSAEFQECFGQPIVERYGMTETLITLAQPLDAPHRIGSVGTPVSGIEARIVDARMQTVEEGQEGQLLVRGTSVGPGYWRDEESSREVLHDGWFQTGDLARKDPADGQYSIVGRAKEIIISGGYNVHPREVEERLQSHPDVMEVAVFGTPDPDLGEAVAAAVVLVAGADPDPRRLIEHCRQGLASFKKPRQIRVLAELPRNAMGKVQKDRLRQPRS